MLYKKRDIEGKGMDITEKIRNVHMLFANQAKRRIVSV